MKSNYDERWIQGKILTWMNEVLKELKLPFEVEQEVKIRTPKGIRWVDLFVWKVEKGREPVCAIELKQPFIDAYDEELIAAALNKATSKGSPFFVTWNVNKLVLWETFKPGTDLLERRLKHWDVVEIKRPKELLRAEIERPFKNFLKEFFQLLYTAYEQKLLKPEVPVIPLLSPDDILVLRLRTAVESLFIPLSDYIIENKKKDKTFYKKVAEWFIKQGWIFQDSEDDYDRLARQVLYLLINKILFYNVLGDKFKLSKIDLKKVKSGEELKRELEKYFRTGIKLGYPLVFAADFLEEIPFPDEIVPELIRLVHMLEKYDFSKIGYDIIGKVFEKLIPKEERHKLGQYFTRSDVVDLILGFSVKSPDDKILDPACGSGTFLVRAYQMKKKFFKVQKSHSEILKELWGIDISKFPATLAEINLIIRDIMSEDNKPFIICKDFFDVDPDTLVTFFEPANHFKDSVRGRETTITFPKDFDVVVANPPYTRQEEMEDLLIKGYKERLVTLIRRKHGFTIGKRSGIHVYFFIHSSSFLKEGKRMGYITSNSWLDVDYGKYLQEFFLKNFKIIAIIESKVERWFEDADINTAITIVEKCNNKEERDNNRVKFVLLKKKLSELFPPENDAERFNKVKEFVELIENAEKHFAFEEIKALGKTIKFFENDDFRIVLVKQEDLWKEGYDEEEKKYVGSKWGKYLRAPSIFFKILEKGKDLFVPLKEIAEVRRGFTTGVNEFFYLTEERIKKLGIEREFWMHPVTKEEWKKIKEFIPKSDIWEDKNGKYFKKSQWSEKFKIDDVLIDGKVIWIPNYVVKSPRELKTIVVQPKDLKYRVLLIFKDKKDLKGTKALKYVEWGESQGFRERPTCKSRKRWYSLENTRFTKILFLRATESKPAVYFSPTGVFHDQTFYSIIPYEIDEEVLSSLMNSTLINYFIREIFSGAGGALGQGALWSAVYEVLNFPIPTVEEIEKKRKLLNCWKKFKFKKVSTVFEELGTDLSEGFSLDKVKPDRRELDEIVMGEILGLTKEEQIEVYRAIIDLVKSRIERAASVKRRKKKESIDIEKIVDNVLSQINIKIGIFPDDYVEHTEDFEIRTFPLGKPEVGNDLMGVFVIINGEKIRCKNKDEAYFIKYALMCGQNTIKIPKDEKIIKNAVKKFSKVVKLVNEKVSELLEAIPDKKVRNEVHFKVMDRIFKKKSR